ncbi:uncharacterized protein LOC129919570 isoform X2 [Episyrphus balteatus]|uniref:uncharacterized protein LOC129919570 isoform X2 n=1 Tax=Episyrphus balteatus TaxID=286459 RepID=UPI002485B1C5|nr:uncharacterized protein LOC129919570 isoform X2 [Episyrphus balteatus]
MDLRPLNYDELCQLEMLRLSNATMVPVMVIPASAITSMDGGGSVGGNNSGHRVIGTIINDTNQHHQQLEPPSYQLHHHPSSSVSAAASASVNPIVAYQQQQPYYVQSQSGGGGGSMSNGCGSGAVIMPSLITNEQTPTMAPIVTSAACGGVMYPSAAVAAMESTGCPRHRRLSTTSSSSYATLTRSKAPSESCDDSQQSRRRAAGNTSANNKLRSTESTMSGMDGNETVATTCIPGFSFGGCSTIDNNEYELRAVTGERGGAGANNEDYPVVGCNALAMMSIAGDMVTSGALVGTLRRAGDCVNSSKATSTPKRVSFKREPGEEETMMESIEVARKQSCTSGAGAGTSSAEMYNSYMSFDDNFMDYQTTGFGGLPDVTEHSNIRRSISRQNSISNSDSIEISSIQKTKGLTIKPNTSRQSKNQNDTQQHASSKRNFCIYTLSLMAALALSLVAAMLAYQHFLMAPSRNSHEQRLRIVRRILRDVPLVDGHNDFAWNVRKYAHSSLELVELSHDMDHKSMWNRPAWSQTDITRLRQGLVGVQAWSAYVPCEAQGLDAVQLALEQIDIIHRLTDMYPKDTALVTSYQEILTVRRQGLMASMIGIEGGHAIGSSLGVLRSYHSLGARYLSLTHKCDIPWAGSSASAFEMGLSTFGKAVVKEMNRLGMMIDLSQSSDETARDVFQVTRAPVIFSHSAARQLCNSTRNIPDDVLRMVADNGGLIMISFDSEVVSCGRTSTLLDVVAHIKYIRMIAGIQHIGIGAGYDGIEQPPVGLENVSKYPDLLATLLEDPNWSEEDIAMLAGKNFLRVLKSVENVRDYWKRAAIPPGEVSEQLPKTHCTYMSS